MVFIDGNVMFGNNPQITAGKGGTIVVYATKNITFTNNATLSGVAVIAGGNIVLKNNTTLSGALIAKGNIQFGQNSTYKNEINEYINSELNLSKVTATTWEK